MKEMSCPICKNILKVTGQDRIQVITEHVFNPNDEPSLKDIYQCSNVLCAAYTNGLVWSESGEFFDYNSRGNYKYPFISNNNGPFGSITRRLNVEIYKRDENFFLFKSKWFDIEVVWKYKADENGYTLSKRPSIAMWKWEGDKLGAKIGWQFPWSSFTYRIKSFYRERKYKQVEDLKEFFVPSNWNKDTFFVKASATYLKLIHRSIYKKVQA